MKSIEEERLTLAILIFALTGIIGGSYILDTVYASARFEYSITAPFPVEMIGKIPDNVSTWGTNTAIKFDWNLTTYCAGVEWDILTAGMIRRGRFIAIRLIWDSTSATQGIECYRFSGEVGDLPRGTYTVRFVFISRARPIADESPWYIGTYSVSISDK